MKFVLKIGSILFIFIFLSCNRDCENVDKWIEEAPKVLEEYIEVKEEVLANNAFIEEFTKGGDLYLIEEDTVKYSSFNQIKLKNWFKNDRGSILIRGNGSEEITFRTCNGDTWGDLFHGERLGNYKSTVQIIDSLELKDGWIAYVVSCKDCDD